VYLATIGPEAVFTPRLTFARNMFGVAGIAAVSGPVSGYDRRVSPVACLCSSDAVYNDEGSAAVAALRSAGADTVLITGRGLDLEGVDRELGVGTDMLGLLGPVLDRLEVGS
jgi:methylmalonyl-CoA mutase